MELYLSVTLFPNITNINFIIFSSALKILDDNHHLGKYSREKELKRREKLYRWECVHA